MFKEIYNDLKSFLAEKALWYTIAVLGAAWIGYAIYKSKQSSATQDATALQSVAASMAEPSSQSGWGASLLTGYGAQGTMGGVSAATSPTTNGLTSTADNTTGPSPGANVTTAQQ